MRMCRWTWCGTRTLTENCSISWLKFRTSILMSQMTVIARRQEFSSETAWKSLSKLKLLMKTICGTAISAKTMSKPRRLLRSSKCHELWSLAWSDLGQRARSHGVAAKKLNLSLTSRLKDLTWLPMCSLKNKRIKDRLFMIASQFQTTLEVLVVGTTRHLHKIVWLSSGTILMTATRRQWNQKQRLQQLHIVCSTGAGTTFRTCRTSTTTISRSWLRTHSFRL